MSKIPACNGTRHRWTPDTTLGCKENPGVLGGNGTRLTIVHACTRCGCRKVQQNFTGGQYGPMLRGYRTTYESARQSA